MATAAEIVKQAYENFKRGDVPAVLAVWDPNIHWLEAEHTPYADGNPYVGIEAVVSRVLGRLAADFQNFAPVPEEFIADDTTVVALGRYHGTSVKTGLSLGARFAHVWRVKNGKVVAFEQITDSAQWQRVAG